MIDQKRLGPYAVLTYIVLLYVIMKIRCVARFPAILAHFSEAYDD